MSGHEHFSVRKDIWPDSRRAYRLPLGVEREQERMIQGLCAPDRLLDVLRTCAFRLSRAGVGPTFENQTILHDVAEQLGDHPAVIPVYGFWDGPDAVNYETTGESPFGTSDDHPAESS